MKLTITAEDYDKLDDGLKKEYQQDGDGYKLKVDGLDLSELDDLKESVQRLEDNNKQLLKEKRDAQKKAEADAKAAAEASGDVESIKEAHKQELESLKSEYEEKLSKRNSQIESLTTGSQATQLAADLAVEGSASTLSRLIRDRMRTTFDDDGNAQTVVLDADGKESSMSIDDLRAEIIADKSLAPLISGSKGSGAGNTANPGGGSTGSKPAAQMTVTEKSQFISEHGAAEWQSKVQAENKAAA